MVIPLKFRKTGEAVIASFSFTEISSGLGFINFYGFVDDDSAGFDYFLSSQGDVRSEDIETLIGGSEGLIIDKDFDLSPFVLPQTIKGSAIISFAWYLHATHAGDITHVNVHIRKVSAGETTLVTGTGKDWTIGASDSTHLETFVLDIPQTHFKIGDILRITLMVTLTSGGTSAGKFLVLAHDPANRKDTYVDNTGINSTIFKAAIPFKIDL